MSKLDGKVALVTGASKGIGAAIAEALGAAGAAVAVNYASSREGADRVVAAITGAGGKAVAVQGDVSKSADIGRIFAAVDEAFGRLDILVNNAGVYAFAPLEDVTEDEFHRQFNTNVLGMILSTQAAVKLFPAGLGTVINIGSLVTRITSPQTVVYTATKGAVAAITHVLAKELGPKGIRVNSIDPGVIDTEGARAMGVFGTEFETNAIAQTPLGRIGIPSDIAPVAVFLASDESGWITGETLLASGGMR
jgi:3-oxoacyl-[acyl-carrier protein] reductase